MRARLPSGTIEVIVERMWLTAESAGRLAGERHVPRVDGKADAARARVGAPGGAAGVEDDLGEPVRRRGRAVPWRIVAPVKEATKASAGVATRSAAVPCWRMRPSTMTPTRVGERGGVLEVVGDEDRGEAQLAEQLVELEPHTRLWCGRRGPRVARRGEGRRVRRRGRGRARRAGARRPRARGCAPSRGARCGTARAGRRRARRRGRRSGCCARTSRWGKSAYSWKR